MHHKKFLLTNSWILGCWNHFCWKKIHLRTFLQKRHPQNFCRFGKLNFSIGVIWRNFLVRPDFTTKTGLKHGQYQLLGQLSSLILTLFLSQAHSSLGRGWRCKSGDWETLRYIRYSLNFQEVKIYIQTTDLIVRIWW